LADFFGGMAGTADHEQDCRRQCGCPAYPHRE
jgi:hypothetical protein